MPDVELVATRDFSYATRRLKAGDSFTVPANVARVLVGIKKAEPQRAVGRVAPPPRDVVEKAETATPAKAEAPAKPKTTRRRTRKAATKKD